MERENCFPGHRPKGLGIQVMDVPSQLSSVPCNDFAYAARRGLMDAM